MFTSIPARFIYILLVISHCSGGNDELFERFQNPPAESQPFVRWWWNGNCVEEKEIIRELDILKAAGIGGIEINPIAMPADAVTTDSKSLTWGSLEWAQMVKAAIDGARERDMITDVIIGTGWPFGGKFLTSDEQIKGAVLNTIPVEGPSQFKGTIDGLAKILKRGDVFNPEAEDNPPRAHVLFMQLIPENVNKLNQCIDVTDQCDAKGRISIEVPAGKYILALGTIHSGTGFRTVSHGAPGADGPCLDHYNQAAVRKYCDRLADALEPVLGRPLGRHIRALFVDSIELSGSNWTDDFLEEFRRRNGYDLEPYFPFVLYVDTYQGYQTGWTSDAAFNDTIDRVRYDYNKTLVDIFLERFTTTYHQWCNDHGMLSRYQAYGTPWLMGMALGYMIPDIPESNNWLFSPDAYTHGYNIWNKYTSTGGHLTGRRIISCEAMTNTRGVFQATLDMFKQADDLNFIMGINHSVLHGFNYSPPEAGFPGWVRYGAYFSEQNTWWRYFKLWAAYNARLSAVFQSTRPVVDYAVLAPTADIWRTAGLARVPFHLTPWYCHRLWEPIHQNGGSVDYISETVLQSAEMKQSKMYYGPMQYKVVIVCDAETIQPQTALALEKFAQSGGKIVFVDAVPHRSPSLTNAEANDRIVHETCAQLVKFYEKNVFHIVGPENQEHMIGWVQALIDKVGIEPVVRIRNPHPSLYQIHHRLQEKDIVFFTNADNEQDVSFEVELRTDNKIPWQWNPETGEKSVFPHTAPDKLNITLGSVESLLLVFESGRKSGKGKARTVDWSDYEEIDTEWVCHFQHTKEEPFTRTLTRLIDFSRSDDVMLQTFAGTVSYSSEIDLQDPGRVCLDLGKVFGVSEVSINGQQLGSRWYGRHMYDAGPAIQAGKNSVEIKVTTVLYNYMKSLSDNPTAQRWTESTKSVPAGMLGPVRLYARL